MDQSHLRVKVKTILVDPNNRRRVQDKVESFTLPWYENEGEFFRFFPFKRLIDRYREDFSARANYYGDTLSAFIRLAVSQPNH